MVEALLTDMNGFAAEGVGAEYVGEPRWQTLYTIVGISCWLTRATVPEICAAHEILVEENR